MTVAVLIFAILSILAYMWWLVATAPEGYEDEDGFHLIDDDD